MTKIAKKATTYNKVLGDLDELRNFMKNGSSYTRTYVIGKIRYYRKKSKKILLKSIRKISLQPYKEEILKIYGFVEAARIKCEEFGDEDEDNSLTFGETDTKNIGNESDSDDSNETDEDNDQYLCSCGEWHTQF